VGVPISFHGVGSSREPPFRAVRRHRYVRPASETKNRGPPFRRSVDASGESGPAVAPANGLGAASRRPCAHPARRLPPGPRRTRGACHPAGDRDRICPRRGRARDRGHRLVVDPRAKRRATGPALHRAGCHRRGPDGPTRLFGLRVDGTGVRRSPLSAVPPGYDRSPVKGCPSTSRTAGPPRGSLTDQALSVNPTVKVGGEAPATVNVPVAAPELMR
jgi:hypothetical protein